MSEITVAVPSYEHAKFIERTLRSIFAQSLRPKKLIVIDDGSKDESPAVIERVLRDCPFPSEFTARENRGLCATLNEAIAKAEGEYFAYLGSDDIWLPDFLASRVRLLDESAGAVLAFGHAFLIDENDHIVDCTADWVKYREGNTLENLLAGIMPVTSSTVFRRSALCEFGWNENAILEDYELYLKLAVKGSFVSGEDILACWRKHLRNVSNDTGSMLDEWLAAQNRVAAETGIFSEELPQIQRRLKFLSATNLLRAGQRKAAVQLMKKNWRGAKSMREFTELLIRLAMPEALHKYFQNRRKEKQMSKYRQMDLQL